MPAAGDHYFAHLSTDPIFDDGIFCAEALCLPDCQNEDDLDARILNAAREAGILDPQKHLRPDVQNISAAVSTMTVSSMPRSSMSISIRSGKSHSTCMTSQPSRTSKDHTYGDQSPVSHSRPHPRTSLSLEYYDSVLERFRPSVRHKHTASGISRSPSVLSDSASLPTSPTRKHKRTSGVFSLFRKNSNSR